MANATAVENPFITMTYFRRALRSFGTTPERRNALLEGTGVSEAQLADPNAHIDIYHQFRQIDNLNHLEGEGWVLKTPDLWNHSAHGVFGMAAVSAPNLAVAVDVLARYTLARMPVHKIRLHRSSTHLTIEYISTVRLAEAQWRPLIEITFIAIQSLVAAILGRPPMRMEFSFACAAPSYASDVRKVLGVPVVYDTKSNAIRLPNDYLEVPSIFADATLHDHTIADLERARRLMLEPDGIRRRVEHLLASAPVGRLDAESTSRALGISRRTLVRRLADADVCFRDLLDSEMKRRAKELLEAGSLSHADIASLLGYADPTSFSRACRRWFGNPKTSA